MIMQENYIQAPYIVQPITIYKEKVKRLRRVKRNDVPPDYRKDKWTWLKTIIFGPKQI